MTKNVRKIKHNIKKLQFEKRTWLYADRQYVLDDYLEEDETSNYSYESVLAQIKLYDCEIKRLKNMLCC